MTLADHEKRELLQNAQLAVATSNDPVALGVLALFEEIYEIKEALREAEDGQARAEDERENALAGLEKLRKAVRALGDK